MKPLSYYLLLQLFRQRSSFHRVALTRNLLCTLGHFVLSQDKMIYLTQLGFNKIYRLDLDRQLNTEHLRIKTKCNNKIGSELGSSK